MIVFGSNHFKLRSYHPEELGIPFDPNGEKVMIDCIQKYGRLYWIPFIGTGKQWVVRNRKGEMYPLPQKFQKMIPADKRKVKTPFYTFAGPILIVLGICGFMVSEKMEKRQREQAAQERFDENKKLLNEQVADIKVDDYLIFSAKADPDEKNRYGKSYNGIPFKVVEMNNGCICCTIRGDLRCPITINFP